MKNLLIIYFLFVTLIMQFSGIAQTEDPRKIFNRKKIYLTEGQEQLAEKLANSTVFQKREAIYQEIEKSTIKRVRKNMASNPTFYKSAQEVLNDKSLSTTQKNETIKKWVLLGIMRMRPE